MRTPCAVGGQRGSVTAELALALPSVVLMLAALLAVAGVTLNQMRCVDAARAGARAAARREAPGQVVALARAAGPAGAQVSVSSGAGQVVVVVRARVKLLLPGRPDVGVAARAVADLEDAGASAAAAPGQSVAVPGQARSQGPRPFSARSRSNRPGGRWVGDDRGAGTILAVGLIGVLATMSLAVSALGQVVIARHRAAAAADLAALAAAGLLSSPSYGPPVGTGQRGAGGSPCGRAASVAEANGARLVGCWAAPNGSVTVGTVVSVPSLRYLMPAAHAWSRAGPGAAPVSPAGHGLAPAPGAGRPSACPGSAGVPRAGPGTGGGSTAAAGGRRCVGHEHLSLGLVTGSRGYTPGE